MGYERLIRQADQIPFEGWDFGVFRGRFVEAEPSWEFSKLLRTLHATMESGAPLKVNGLDSWSSHEARDGFAGSGA